MTTKDIYDEAREAFDHITSNMTQLDKDGFFVSVSREALEAVLTVAAQTLYPNVYPTGLLATAMRQRDQAEAENAETYEIGKRDGYSDAVAQVDCLTGGDGEYRCCTNGDPERHTPDPDAMIRRIVERFETITAQRDEAVSALKPFGKVGFEIISTREDHEDIDDSMAAQRITWGDLRRASEITGRAR